MLEPLIFNPVQVKYVRTIVGWYNVYLVNYPKVNPVNLSPEQFREIFPSISPKARLGCDEIDRTYVKTLFGSFPGSKTA